MDCKFKMNNNQLLDPPAVLADNVPFTIIYEWWSKYKCRLSCGSVKRKENIIEKHLIPAFEKEILPEITEIVLSEYIKHKHETGNLRSKSGGLSYETLRSHFNIIRPFFDWAVSRGYMRYNVARNIKIPRLFYCARPFTNEEIKKIIKYAMPKYMKDVIILAYRIGLRRGEIYGLQANDFNPKKKCLSIQRIATAYTPEEVVIHPPKTKTSKRSVCLDRVCVRILRRRIIKNKGKSEYIFCDKDGKLLSPWDNTRYFVAACNKAGVPGSRFYDLRHAHATILLMHGVHPKVVQERLGHSSFRITMDTYSHVFPTIQKQAVKVFNRLSVNISMIYIIEDKILAAFNYISAMFKKFFVMLRRTNYEYKRVFERN